VLQLVLLGVLFGAAATAVAYFVPWLPAADSTQAKRIHSLFWFVTAISIGVFALVAAVIVYSIIHFRAGPDDDSDGVPLHGNTGLEIVWTAFPAVLVTAITIVSAVILVQNGRAGADPLQVDVTAQQFLWSFSYPQYGNIVSPTLNLPVDRSVVLHLKSVDVIHSFWVPEFSQKQDAVPGIDTRLVITPRKIGTYPVICTELCGLGHALMRSRSIVTTKSGFQQWAAAQKKALNGPPGQAGLAVFNAQGCGSCHTFKPAGSTGKVGPALDNLPADAKRAGKSLAVYLRESIVDPNAYVVPGYPSGVMPDTFAHTIPADQLKELVAYLQTGTG
jgi:cytochrome c oxidase subunit II